MSVELEGWITRYLWEKTFWMTTHLTTHELIMGYCMGNVCRMQMKATGDIWAV